MKTMDLIKKYKDLYRVTLRNTGSKEDAIRVVRYVANLDAEREVSREIKTVHMWQTTNH